MKINLQPKIYSLDFHKIIEKTTKTNSQLCKLAKRKKQRQSTNCKQNKNEQTWNSATIATGKLDRKRGFSAY